MIDHIWTRPFQLHDLPQIEGIHRCLYPASPHFDPAMAEERIWVVGRNGELWGYTAVLPIPGLERILELQGGVLPQKRRQGAASRLLRQLLDDLEDEKPLQLSYGAMDTDAPAAHFLYAHRFYNEHEEWLYERPLDDCPLPTNAKIGARVAQFPDADQRFLSLYDTIFAPHPWYQPFSTEELAETLNSSADILFLMENGRAIGFAWTGADGSIEPIGILPQAQGRGYGRYLLMAALNHLRQQGMTTAKIGVWGNNKTAVRLYESLGFQQVETLTYLARDL